MPTFTALKHAKRNRHRKKEIYYDFTRFGDFSKLLDSKWYCIKTVSKKKVVKCEHEFFRHFTKCEHEKYLHYCNFTSFSFVSVNL